jgi:hypothetical protein
MMSFASRAHVPASHRRAGQSRHEVSGTIILVAVLAGAATAELSFHSQLWSDWVGEARPSVDALLAGHLAAFLRLAPIYGGSLLLRAPFMALARIAGGGGNAVYEAGALPCLLAAAALGIWLAAQLRRRGSGLVAQAAVLVMCASGPFTIIAMQQGHPEELLGAVLCVSAVLCAQHERAAWSGVLVGLAIVNKEWGILAAGPVLVALPHGRGRALAAMTATAGALLAPFVLVRAGGFVGQSEGVALHSDAIFGPLQLWWFFGAAIQGGGRIGPSWLGGLGHTLAIALMVPLTLAAARFATPRPAARREGAMLLLALLLLLRCALDPWDVVYYPVPFLVTLIAWEAITFTRPPFIALAACLVTWFVFQGATVPFVHGQDAISVLFITVTLPAIGAIAWRLFAPAAPVTGDADLDRSLPGAGT